MSKQVISEIPNRESFFHLLKHNPGLIVIKLGAEWCGPCKQIKNVVHAFFASSPPEVVCADIKPLEFWFQIFEQNKNFSLDLKEYENCLKEYYRLEFDLEKLRRENNYK